MQPSNPDISQDGANKTPFIGEVEQDETLFLKWDFAVIQVPVMVIVDRCHQLTYAKVENIMFRIPRQPLIELSQHLRAILTKGSNELNPLILDDDISAAEFRTFLRMVFTSHM